MMPFSSLRPNNCDLLMGSNWPIDFKIECKMTCLMNGYAMQALAQPLQFPGGSLPPRDPITESILVPLLQGGPHACRDRARPSER
jgi:hypothetical protein